MDQNMSPAPVQKNNAAIVSLICGIVSAVFAWWGWFSIVSIAAGIVAIIFYTKAVKFSSYGKGMATAGLVCGIVGLAFGVIICICTITALATLGNLAGEIGQYIKP